MPESKTAIGSSTPSLPRWLAKTHSRYDEDNIAFSPPSEDGATFFSLHATPTEELLPETAIHKSTFDRINEELGFAETPDGRRVSVGRAIQGGKRRGSIGGTCITTELQQHSYDQGIESIDDYSMRSNRSTYFTVTPLLKIPYPFSSTISPLAAPTTSSSSQQAPDSPAGDFTTSISTTSTSITACAAASATAAATAATSAEFSSDSAADTTVSAIADPAAVSAANAAYLNLGRKKITPSDAYETTCKNEKKEAENLKNILVAIESEDLKNKREIKDKVGEKPLGLLDRVLKSFTFKANLKNAEFKKTKELGGSVDKLTGEVELFVKEQNSDNWSSTAPVQGSEYRTLGSVVMEHRKSVNTFFFRAAEAVSSDNTADSRKPSTCSIADAAAVVAADAALQQASKTQLQERGQTAGGGGEGGVNITYLTPQRLAEIGGMNEPGSIMTSRPRRPKPSRLREMNFWAPTSM